MAVRHILWKSERMSVPLLRFSKMPKFGQQFMTYSSPTRDNKNEKEDINNEDPVPFSTSKAAEFNSLEAEMNQGRTNRPEHEPGLIRFCLSAFLIYFCLVREESDWDVSLTEPIYDKVPDLEIIMLRDKKYYASRPGGAIFSEADRLRLEELEKSKN